MATGKQCGVCCTALSKYKCPACRIPYCSVVCFKKHKETPCSIPQPTNPDQEPQPPQPLVFEDQEELGLKLTRSQLEAFAACAETRDMLKDPELQQLVRQIDTSQKPEEELERARGTPAFEEFVSKVLVSIGVEEKGGDV